SDLVIIYNTKDEIKTEVTCGTETVNEYKNNIELPERGVNQITNGICRVIDYAIAVDYSTFLNHGSSIDQTSNYILSIMNLVEGNYVGVFTDDLYYKISEILIFTSPQVNPWVFNPDIAANLNLFTAWAPTGFTKPFDDASYWYTQGGVFQPVGFAWVNTTCATNGFNTNVIREYGGTIDNMRCLIAHEIGHNFGCGHTSGFIMNPSVNNATTWAPESISTVNNRIAGSGGACIMPCNYNICETLVTPAVAVTDNGSQLIVNWTANTNPTRIEYRNTTTGPFTLVGTYNNPINFAQISHNPNCNVTEYFQIRVTSVCPNTNTGVPTIIVKQSIGGIPPTPTISIAATSSNQCSATFVATISNGGAAPIFQWKINGVTVGTNSISFASVNLGNNDIVSCSLTSSLSCVTANNISSNAITFQGPTPTIAIVANSTIFCGGANATFNATTTNAGSSPIYQWKVNGVNVGINANSYSTITLNHNDVVTCVLTSSITCVTANNITSNSITVNLAAPISNYSFIKIGLTVNFSNLSTCAAIYSWDFGDGVTSALANPVHTYAANGMYNVCLTVTNVNGTNQKCLQIPIFNSWTDNMNGTTNGASNLVTYQNTYCDGESYFNGTLAAFNDYPVIRYDKQVWLPKQGTIEMLVKVQNGYTSFGGNSTTSATIFAVDSNGLTKSSFIVGYSNGNVSFRRFNTTTQTFTDVTATATPFRFNEWHVVSVSYGSIGTIIKVDGITYATNTTANFQLNDGHGFLGGANFQDAANWWGIYGFKGLVDKFRVSYSQSDWQLTLANQPPTAAVSASANNICLGTSVTFTATTNAPTANYQWKKNGVNVGSNIPTYTDNSLTNGNTVTCVITALSGCFSTPTGSSNTITMVVNTPAVPVTTITASVNNICPGTSVTFTATTNAPTANYQWKKNGVNVGTNTTTYADNALLNNDQVSCVVSATSGCFITNATASNNITINVVAPLTPVISIAATRTNPCAGENVVFTSTPVNGGATPSYQWKRNGNNVATGSTYSTTGLVNGDIITCVLTTSLNCVTSSMANSNSLTIAVRSVLTPVLNITATATTICANSSITFTAVTNIVNPVYQWKINGINSGTNSNNLSISTLNNNDIISCSVTAPPTDCYTAYNVNSNSIAVTVRPLLTPAIAINSNDADNTLCEGQPIIFTAIAANAGSMPVYQWKKNGVNAGSNSAYFTLSSPSDNDEISCIITSNESCLISNNIESNKIRLEVIKVNPVITQNGYSLTVNPKRPTASWQWYKDGQPIIGANSSAYSATVFGNYTVKETYKTCVAISAAISLNPFVNGSTEDVRIYPNPADNILYAQSRSPGIIIKSVNIYDESGRLMQHQVFSNTNLIQLNISALSSSIYIA
ncbi:MAG: PKD domain-containing protein, partial [Ferruginibacter sp.]